MNRDRSDFNRKKVIWTHWSLKDDLPSISLLSALLFFGFKDLQSQIAAGILFYGGVCDLLRTDANNPIKTKETNGRNNNKKINLAESCKTDAQYTRLSSINGMEINGSEILFYDQP